ncbi:MAG: hypothetical protein ABEJ56_02870 [Candidatus Nanohaloarchaea archaeon]
MNSSRPVPVGYGSLMNFTSIPQRVAGLLVDKGYIDQEDLRRIGLHTGSGSLYTDFGKILERDGIIEEVDFEDNEGFQKAVDKTLLRAGLRKELNEGYGAEIGRNREDSLLEYIAGTGLVSKQNYIDNYIGFFAEEGLIPDDYDEKEYRESFAKLVTKAMLDEERNEGEYDPEDVFRPMGKYVWDEMRSGMEITPVPVQIPGKRGYWIEPVTKEGLMLGAVETDEEEKMTVMAFPRLEEEFYQELIADENEESEKYSVNVTEVEIPEEIEKQINQEIEEIPEEARYLLMNPESPEVNTDSDKEPNMHYHSLIEETEKMLSEIFGEYVGEWVVERYRNETSGIEEIDDNDVAV